MNTRWCSKTGSASILSGLRTFITEGKKKKVKINRTKHEFDA